MKMRAFSLRFTLLFFTIAIIIAEGSLYYFVHMNVATKRAVEDRAQNDLLDGAKLAYVVEKFYLAGSEDLAKTAISQGASDPGVILIALLSSQNKIIYSTDNSLNGSNIGEKRPGIAKLAEESRRTNMAQREYDDAKGVLRFAFPLKLGAKKGDVRPEETDFLYIEDDVSSVKTLLRSEAWHEFSFVIPVVSLSSLIFWIFIIMAITNRMRMVEAASAKIAAGDYGARVNLPGGDELARIGEAFDKMAGTVQQRDRELRDSEEKYKLLFDSGGDIVFVHKIFEDGGLSHFLEANDAACEKLGYSRDELLGMTPKDVIASFPEMGEEVRKNIEKLITEGKAIFERLLVTKEGSTIPVEMSATAFTLQGEKMILAVGRDVSKRKKAEEALNFARRRFEDLVNKAEGIVWEADAWMTAFTFVSKKAEEILGYPLEEWKTPDFWENHIHPDDRDYVKNLYTTASLAHHSIELDYRFFSKDGRVVWISDVVNVISAEGGANVLRGLMIDVTGRRNAEEAIRESEEKYRAMFNSGEDMVMVNRVGENGEHLNYVEVNGAACARLGYIREELMSLKPDSIVWPNEKSWAAAQGKIRADGGAVFEILVKTKNGGQIPVEVSARMFRMRGILYSLSILRDVTERVRLREREKENQRQLVQADRMKSLGILTAGVAHEINNPNSFVMLNSPIIQRIWKDTTAILDRHHEAVGDFTLNGLPYSKVREAVPDLIEGISAGAQRINHIVGRLKDFSMKRPSVSRGPVCVENIVKNALRFTESFISSRTNRFAVTIGDGLPEVMGNSEELEQVVINLVVNACQALQNKDKAVTVSAYSMDGGKTAVIQVADEGTGIREEDLGKILDPFFTTKRSAGGTGLGLSISSQIIREHGGEMKFVSSFGKGCTVQLLLPAVNGASEAGAHVS